MRGKEVFYPVGWDDNGLATERRVQNHYGVRCDPAVPYRPGLTPPAIGNSRALTPADQLPVSRRNFVELCRQLTELDENAYAEAWRRLGLSVDWDASYRTIDGIRPRSRTGRSPAPSSRWPSAWQRGTAS